MKKKGYLTLFLMVAVTWFLTVPIVAGRTESLIADDEKPGQTKESTEESTEVLSAVDKKELRELLDKKSSLKKADYTKVSWENYQSIWTEANRALVTENKAQVEIDQLVATLKAAQEKLEIVVDRTKLKEELIRTDTLDPNDYTPNSWKIYYDALVKARKLPEESRQQQVDQAVKNLQIALNQLVKCADTTQLQKALIRKEGLRKADYTAKSWNNYQAVWLTATAVSGNKNSSQQEVDAITKQLVRSRDQLAKAARQTRPKKNIGKKQKKAKRTVAEKAKPSPATAHPTVSGPIQAEVEAPAIEKAEIGVSNFGSYELPLLNSFADKKRAALIFGGIQAIQKIEQKKLAEKKQLPINKQFLQGLYREIYLLDKKPQQIKFSQAQPGDLIQWKKANQAGAKEAIYLGNDYYLAYGILLKNMQKPQQKKTEMKQTIFRLGLTEKPAATYDLIGQAKLTGRGKQLLKNYPVTQEYRVLASTQKFIDSFAEEARQLGQKYDLFASVMIAQAILESGSGSSLLSRAPFYNLFGIKGSFQGKSANFLTAEEDHLGSYKLRADFRSYSNYHQSLNDYAKLLRNGVTNNKQFYQPVWRSRSLNYLAATSYLTGRYATDSQYYDKLNSLIATYHLTQYDLPKSKKIVASSYESIPVSFKKGMKFGFYDDVERNTSGSYPYGQCTWYVYNRLAQLGVRMDEHMGNGGEWGETARRLGYQVRNFPQTGAAVSFRPGMFGSSPSYGHVAFVENVTKEGILISESNVYGLGKISYRLLTVKQAIQPGVAYIMKK